MALSSTKTTLKGKPLENVRDSVPVEVVTKDSLVRVNFNISEETRKRWKIECVNRGITMSELVEGAVEAFLKK